MDHPLLDDPSALARALALAHEMADAAGAVALAHFRQPALATENKAARGFDPVTEADRRAEAEIRRRLLSARPEDGVFGEEEAPRPSRSGLTWVVDPIDGTRAFISGLPTWGILIALDDGRAGRIGLVDHPALGERFWGVDAPTGGGAWFRDRAGARPTATRPAAGLAEATLFTTDPDLFDPDDARRFARVRSAARLCRYGVDCYAYALLALGQIDLVIEAGLAAYDVAAPTALVLAAGGVVTDWEGGDPRWGGRILAAGDARVHAEALARLAG